MTRIFIIKLNILQMIEGNIINLPFSLISILVFLFSFKKIIFKNNILKYNLK